MDDKNINNTEASEKKKFSEKIREFNSNKIQNKAFFRRGGYSLAITAIVLAVIILFNFLVGKLANKIELEFDMSAGSTNSITEENRKYLKGIKDEVEVIVCATKADYTNYLLSYSPQLFGVTGDERYFNQTVKFLDKYSLINDKIKIKFVDVQSTEYTAISQKYPNYTLSFGDIIVTCTKNGNTRDKHLGFKNIYDLYDVSGYAAYGYDYYQISANNIESALTSAISYVTSSETHKIALYKGHSVQDNTEAYRKLLEDNNYEVDVVADAFFSAVPDKYDAIALMAPSSDFIDSELDALSSFLDNGGKGGKGVIYFADAVNPSLPKLNAFLLDWGIIAEDGLLLETNENYMPNKEERSALYSVPNDSADFTAEMKGFITGYNIPMMVDEDAAEDLTVIKVASTPQTVVKAPAGVTGDWSDYTEEDMRSYETVIESKKEIGEKSSYVFAFSSIEFINSSWAENTSLENKNLVIGVSDIASGNVANSIKFVAKSVDMKGFAGDVSERESNRVKTVFAIIIPIAVLLWGIYVFIRRRNSK